MSLEPNAPNVSPEVVSFHAATVSGSQEIPIEIERKLSVRAVTDSIATRMGLPQDVAWSLRDDGSSAYLDENRPIGEQIEPGARVSVTPRTHLGGATCSVV